MTGEREEWGKGICRSLARLDVCQHSLKLMGKKLLSEGRESPSTSSEALYERSLQLGEDCVRTLQLLCAQLNSEDRGFCRSTLNRVEAAIDRVSVGKIDTVRLVNVWRAVEAIGQFLAFVAERYGYSTISQGMALEPGGWVKSGASAATELVEKPREPVGEKVVRLEPVSIPSFRVPPRWHPRRLLSRPGLVLGVLIILAFAITALSAPVIAAPEGDNPYVIPRDGYLVQPQPPSTSHPLGTLEKQYDVLYGLVWGARVAFKIGLSVTIGRALIGVFLGLVSGYYGGLLDAVIMRITDSFLAFPIVPAAMLMLAFLGPTVIGGSMGGVDLTIVMTLITFGWMQYARLVRGNVLAERGKEYVEAVVAVGARTPRIILRHLLPNVHQGLFVLLASDVGGMVVLATVFTFLGLSGGRGAADWGWMLNVSRNWIVGTPSNAFEYWYTYVPVSMAVVFFTIGWSLMGDGLRDVLDPRLR